MCGLYYLIRDVFVSAAALGGAFLWMISLQVNLWTAYLLKNSTTRDDTMATVSYSVPDEIKAVFNETFADQNKSTVIAELMREGVERARRKKRSNDAIAGILARREFAPEISEDEFRVVREEGRP